MSEKNENNEEEGAIYRVDTVPPPDGEGDAYSAPTRVGPMADSVLKEMMHALESKTAALSQRAAERPKPAAPSEKPSPAAETTSASQRPNPAMVASTTGSAPLTAPPPPKRPLAPRPTPAPRAGVRPSDAVPAAAAAPTTTTTSNAPAPNADSGAPGAMPSFYDDTDDVDDSEAGQFAPTQLHANAGPPPPQAAAQAVVRTPETESLPSMPVPAASMSPAAPRPRTPIPFDPGPPARAPDRFALFPLAVGFGVFVVGLVLYLLVR